MLTNRFRSKFEKRIAKNSKKGWTYESLTLSWQPPIKKYTPDFILPNGVIVEAKGHFNIQDRLKMLCVIAQHPEKDIRMLFMNANNKISKKSKTSYGGWCDNNGIKWAEGSYIPNDWYK